MMMMDAKPGLLARIRIWCSDYWNRKPHSYWTHFVYSTLQERDEARKIAETERAARNAVQDILAEIVAESNRRDSPKVRRLIAMARRGIPSPVDKAGHQSTSTKADIKES
jgi:hypothetical protein